MARQFAPVEPVEIDGRRSVFLAGSIDGGRAENWQARFLDEIGDLDVAVLNPRNDHEVVLAAQAFDCEAFRERVEWELSGLERATVIAMYFVPTTQSPVTLVEFGLFARDPRLVVCCPDGYWRKGSVDVTCARFGTARVPTLEALVAETRRRVTRP